MNENTLSRSERRRKQRELRKEQKRRNNTSPPSATLPNRKSQWETTQEENSAIQQVTEEKLKVYAQLMPGLLKKLARIPDPRDPKKTKHQLAVLMLYGILAFAFQMASRRESNQGLTTPQFIENLQSVFEGLADMPHQDTLCRLLERIDVGMIEQNYIDLLRKLIRKKKFQNLLHQKMYLIAIDGTQKYTMKELWDNRYLRRKVRGKEEEYQYYAYVLEAVMIFSNGMVLPLMSLFLENSKELESIKSDEIWKQDCELKAFYRLAKRLKKEFPRLPLCLLLDGLYANGPVIEICQRYNWKYMIVLKDKSLPTVWEEAKALMRLEEGNRHEMNWQGRRQTFRWVNEIEYNYDAGKVKGKIQIHVAVCEESWDEIDEKGGITIKTARYAWISSDPLNRNNVHERCNLAGRKRWLHENNILKEKHQGYSYEHIFSHNFDAMRGYHYLMHIARLVNEFIVHSISLTSHIKEVGIRACIKHFYIAMSNRELDKERLRQIRNSRTQLRLVCEEDWKTNPSAA